MQTEPLAERNSLKYSRVQTVFSHVAHGVHTGYARWSSQVEGRYGRKQGLLRHYWCWLLYRLGAHQHYRRINWGQVERLIFVCKGNICRSPYCEARARSLGLQAVSFGLQADRNSPAYPTVVALGRLRGLDLAEHRSRPLDRSAFAAGDLLIAMEPWQAKELEKSTIAAEPGPQITLLGLWNVRPRPYVQDPYGMRHEYFETCLTILDESVRRIATEMRHSYAG
jgi:protein-tyrosine phosphatase